MLRTVAIDNPPSSRGEIGLITVAPAITNAVSNSLASGSAT
jgi:CO/xanthine dehydrogenase Mo-binding subunit